MKNRTLEKLRAGKPVYGFASGIGSPIAAETLAASGIDFVFLDGQHGSFGMDRIIDCLAAMGGYPADPVARVPVNDFTWIGRFLDEGCLGIVVPMVNSAGDWGPSQPLAVPDFIQELRKRGVSDTKIKKIVYDNPLEFFRQSRNFQFTPPDTFAAEREGALE